MLYCEFNCFCYAINTGQNFRVICRQIMVSRNTFEVLIINRMKINLFINSDAILNRDALWSIQGEKHYLAAAIQENYCNDRFLSYNGDYVNQFSKHFMLSVST